MHVLTDAADNDNSDISLALDVLLFVGASRMSDIRFCSCSVGFSVDFEKDPVSVHVALLHSTVSLKAKDASSDFRRSHDAPLP